MRQCDSLAGPSWAPGQWPLGLPLLDLPGVRSMALGFHREHKEEPKIKTFKLCQGGGDNVHIDKKEEEVELYKIKKSQEEKKIKYMRVEKGH